ncbi:MAG: CPCC family cysteine-rich protein [Raoultibacter sp.]
MTHNKKKFFCPCCGNVTLTEEPPGTFAVCPVCYWEDDAAQFKDPALAGGSNAVSLNQARENYRAFGACEVGCIEYVRRPLASEKR